MTSMILPTFSPAGLRTSAVDNTFAAIGRTDCLRGWLEPPVASHIPTAGLLTSDRRQGARSRNLWVRVAETALWMACILLKYPKRAARLTTTRPRLVKTGALLAAAVAAGCG